MVQKFLPDFLSDAYRFDDLDAGAIEFAMMFGAFEHAAKHSRGLTR